MVTEKKVTKWMKKPLADHDWTQEEVDKYYEWKAKLDEEIHTKGHETRQLHCGHTNIPKTVAEVID